MTRDFFEDAFFVVFFAAFFAVVAFEADAFFEAVAFFFVVFFVAIFNRQLLAATQSRDRFRVVCHPLFGASLLVIKYCRAKNQPYLHSILLKPSGFKAA